MAIPRAQRHNLPAPTGGLVLNVANETLTVDEVISPAMDSFKQMAHSSDNQEFKTKAIPVATRLVINKMTDILLYQRARNSSPPTLALPLPSILATAFIPP